MFPKLNYKFALLFTFCLIIFLSGKCFAQKGYKEYYNRGLEQAIKGNIEKAEIEFLSGLNTDYPHLTPLKSCLSIIQDLKHKRINKATAVHIFKGMHYANKRNFNYALSELNKAISANPDYAISYNERGSVYGLKKMFDQAIADFNMAIKLNPKFEKAYLRRATIYMEEGKHQEALSDINKALRLNPRYSEAYCLLGNFYTEKGQFGQAIDNYTKAIDLYPKYESAYFSRAAALANAGKFSQAIEDIDFLIGLKPDDTALIFNKAFIYETAGKPEEAIKAYKEFLDAAPFKYMEYINQAQNRVATLSQNLKK